MEASGIPLLGEAITRVRENKIVLEGGYDGDYGKVSIFSPEERKSLAPQKSLFLFRGADTFCEKKSKSVKEKDFFGLKNVEKLSISEKVQEKEEKRPFGISMQNKKRPLFIWRGLP